tara:strand:- start:122 stop:283 length:162 start_codon:yes stop_codon:yes gene_type:complete
MFVLLWWFFKRGEERHDPVKELPRLLGVRVSLLFTLLRKELDSFANVRVTRIV